MQTMGMQPSLPAYFKCSSPPGLCPAAIPEPNRILNPAAPPFEPVSSRMETQDCYWQPA